MAARDGGDGMKTLIIEQDGTRRLIDAPEIEEEAETPALTPRQFAYLKAATKVGDMRLSALWDAVEAALDAMDHPAYASIYADRSAKVFHFDATIEKIAAIEPIVIEIAGAKIDADELRKAWIAAFET